MKLRYILLTAAYCGAIFWLSSGPIPIEVDMPIASSDKLAHFVVYGGLAAIVSVGLRRSNERVSTRVQFLMPLVFASLYGVSDEIHQAFVPSREFDLFDMIADALGAAAMQVFLCKYWWGIWRDEVK